MHKKHCCPFCDWKRKFTYTYFEGIGEKECDAWIDYEEGNDCLSWYAVLCGDQYTEGHTLLILGSHRDGITDSTLESSELHCLSVGLSKVALRLKDVLQAEAVHVLSLSEGIKHLHFHLIPRYNYSNEELDFYIHRYWSRDKVLDKKWVDVGQYTRHILSKRNPHGMWYAAYHEMRFHTSHFGKLKVADRVNQLEAMAKRLRGERPRPPW